MLVLLIITQFLAYQKFLFHQSIEQKRLEITAFTTKNHIKEYLYQSLTVTQALKFILENNGEPKDFEPIGKLLLNINKNLQAVQIVKDSIITHVYPLQGNENVLGYNILKDEKTKLEAFKAIERGMYFAGPFELKQGGKGIVGRVPIMLDGKFDGFAAVVIKLDDLLKVAGIYPSLDPDFVFQLSKINPVSGQKEFFIKQDSKIDFSQGKQTQILIEEGDWTLHVKVKDPISILMVVPFICLGLLFSFTGGYLAWYISRQPYKLNKLVNEKTAMLQAKDKLLEDTQRTAMVGSWEADLKNDQFRWTEVIAEILEVDPTFEPKIDTIIDFFKKGKSRDKLVLVINETIKSGKPFDLELLLITAKKSERWVRITGSAELDGHNCLRIFGTMQDIHTRKYAEEERKDILQSITDGFIAIDGHWNVTYWNYAATEIFDLNSDKAIGRNFRNIVIEKMNDEILEECLLAMENHEVRSCEKYIENLGIWAEISVYPKRHGLSFVLKDVSEHHYQVRAIEDQNMRLKEIAWTQSHVVRAPLAKLMGLVELLKSAPDSERNLIINFILKTADELDQIVRDISSKTDQIKLN